MFRAPKDGANHQSTQGDTGHNNRSYAKDHRSLGDSPRPDAFIFGILDGSEDPLRQMHKTQYLTRAINKRMTDVGERLGIGHISTYTARHSFATVLKRSGVNIAYISESLGHSDLKTTENYLASFEREERQKNAELLTRF